MRIWGTGIGALATVASAAALMGCSAHVHIGGGISTSKLENGIKQQATSLGVAPTSVTCPSNIKEQKGVVTYCTAHYADGHATRFKATQTNGSGHVEISLGDMPAAALEQQIEHDFAQSGATDVTASCPDGKPATKGTMFDCTVTDGKTKKYVKIAVTGNDGEYSHELSDTP